MGWWHIQLSKNILTGDNPPARRAVPDPRHPIPDPRLSLPRSPYPPARSATRWKGECRGHLGMMVTLAATAAANLVVATAAANLVTTLEVGACGVFLFEPNSVESAHLSLLARGWVVRLFTRQWRRIVLSRGIAFQRREFIHGFR